jgi:hypothetical protein
MLANGLEFNSKEQHMLPLNDFIQRNMQVRNEFLDAVSVRNSVRESNERFLYIAFV